MIVLGGFLGEVGSWIQVILGVGMLIFIHESGHFLVAKWAGVRVLAFSLGFGPEMFGFTRGSTRYRVAWIPLGGYVKMSGETELPEGGYAPDDYPAKPVWKRALIIVAGVVMNAVLGFALFTSALLVGIKTDSVEVGVIRQGGPAWEAGIRRGDRLVAADGKRLISFMDVVYATIRGEPVVLTVERDGVERTIPVVPRIEKGTATPSIGIGPRFGSVIKVPPGSAGEKAGFKDGDAVIAIEGIPAEVDDLSDDVFDKAVLRDARALRVTVRRGGAEQTITVPPHATETTRRIGILAFEDTVACVRIGGPAERAGWKNGDRIVSVAGRPVGGRGAFLKASMVPAAAAAKVARAGAEVELPLPADLAERLDLLRDLKFTPSPSPTAVEILPGGAAEAAGVPGGAVIEKVAGSAVAKYEDVVSRIAAVKTGAVLLEWSVGGVKGKADIVPAEIPAYGDIDFLPEPRGELLRASSFGEACSLAFARCGITTSQIVTTVTGIFRGSVDKSNLGGPIAIAQVAKKSTADGAGHFLWLLGMLSINLMFLNTLPIPVLDGGQLALLGVEAVTRKRPSENFVGIVQMAGLVLLLGLMLFVSFQDVVRLLK